MVAVKEERPDEAEIQELAEKMREANKAKMAAPAAAANAMRVSSNPNGSGQAVLAGLIAARNANQAKLPEDKRPIDEESQRGRFGWVTLGIVPIPYILRQGERYCAVRMVESKLLNKFLSYLHADIYNYTNIRSYYITDAESRILNEINLKHCDAHFGRDHFTNKDLVVRLQDAAEFYNFLEVCYNRLHSPNTTPSDRCGFIRINNESVVPYTVKESVKYVPLFYFEGETESLKLKAEALEGWDLAYLKFCCKVQGIRNELFASETCYVISLNDIKTYFPVGTQFDDYWPTKMTDCQLISKNPVANASWTRTPAGAVPPAAAAAKSVVPQPRAFPPNHTPPAAGTPGAAAALPVAMPNAWNNMLQQQQRMAQAQALAGNPWRNNNSPYYAAYHPQMNIQQQQQQAQKNLPPPLVRATAAPTAVLGHLPTNTMAMADQNRPYGVQKGMQMRGVPVMAQGAGSPRYNGYPGSDVMDLSGPQQAAQFLNGRAAKEKVMQIAEVAPSGPHTPYALQKALVESKMVPCINAEPFRYSELLMTLPDFTQHFFAGFAPSMVQKILQDVLKVTLYRGNRLQLEVLRQAGKSRSDKEAPALIQVRDVMQYMPQLKYVLNNKQQQQQQQQQAENVAKRMRIS